MRQADGVDRTSVATDAGSASSPVPWYAGGLHFECTACGRCCTGGNGYVWVETSEITALARHLSLTLDDFGRRYLRRVGERYALLERDPGGDCIFLRDARCSVYEVRPRQCVTFPFWTQNVRSADTWAHTATQCEGVHEQARLVECSEVERLCATGKRGAGSHMITRDL